MKETCCKFVPHIVCSSISGELWVEGIQSNNVQCGGWWTAAWVGHTQHSQAHKFCQICHIPQQGSSDKTCICKLLSSNPCGSVILNDTVF